mgnify:FL=1
MAYDSSLPSDDYYYFIALRFDPTYFITGKFIFVPLTFLLFLPTLVNGGGCE